MLFSSSPRVTFALSSLLGFVACGGTVVSSQAGGTTSGSGASTTVSSGTTSVGSGSTVGSSGGTGGGACGTLTITVDHGTPTILTTNCPGTTWDESATTAVGWYSASPVQMGTLGLTIVACAADSSSAEGLNLELSGTSMGPETYSSGSASFTTGQGSTWTNELGKAVLPIQVDVTSSDGTAIAGTFQLTVADSSQNQHQLFGSFDVCHGEDFLPP
jgi:hypothetical protein